MTIKVLFFAGLREALGVSTETVSLPAGGSTVTAVRDALVARGGVWPVLRTTRNVRAAVNQQMVGFDAALKDGDELAFFPPVTGG